MKKTFLAAAVAVFGLGRGSAVYHCCAGSTTDAGRARRTSGPWSRWAWRPDGTGRTDGRTHARRFAFREVMRDLTDAQREQVKAIHEKHAERIRPLAERAHATHQALENALMSGNTANLQALSIEVGNAETELTFAQAQVQAEILNVLTPEQKQKIAERRKQMEARRAGDDEAEAGTDAQ